MSYNVGSNNWSSMKDSVVARVTTNDPDVFCPIEATQSKLPYLQSSLTDYRLLETFGAIVNSAESHIMLRKNMFTVLDSGYIEVETYVGYTGIGRYIDWAHLQHIGSQQEFVVYASHFVAMFGSSLDSTIVAQYRHADAMVQLMSQHSGLNIPQITVGDFNANVNTDVMQFLINQTSITFNGNTIDNTLALDDSWVVANGAVPKPGTVFAGSSAIDWILTTPDANVLSAIIDDQGSNRGTPPSDHKALQIEFDITNTSSLSEQINVQNFQVYPNPFQDQIHLKFTINNAEPVDIELRDLLGKLVVAKSDFFIPGNSTLTLDCRSLDSGIYFYSVKFESELITGEIVKND
ncbi:MAG: T9SS type A sorting domain-containing protein [Crocinitomicaceae bacterium]|nr:T9SS type A sorting domain-containing protein [Crocinitomicaceae bacterium]